MRKMKICQLCQCHQEHRLQNGCEKFVSWPAKSISISLLLKEGKIIREESTQNILVKMEELDVEASMWRTNSYVCNMRLETKHFDFGGFRLAHKALELNQIKAFEHGL